MRWLRIRARTTLACTLGTAVAASLACGGADTPTGTTAPSTDSGAAASAYLDSAVTLMQTYAFYRSRVDWTAVRAAAHTQAAGAKRFSDTYPAIRSALAALGDHHSFLAPPVSGNVAPVSTVVGTANVIHVALAHPADSLDAEIVSSRFAYLRVPTFVLPTNLPVSVSTTALADTLQALVRAVDAQAPCAWIVDLRHNLGGDMWPMLVGVGPILGGGPLGSFVDATGTVSSWYYTNGAAGTTGSASFVGAQLDRPAYTLRAPNPPVAVLTDSLTASSGEAITVAFRGRPATRSFGAATYGVPTANAGYVLPDRAVLVLMDALDVDRLGNRYDTRIPPDEPVATSAAPATDDGVVTSAIAWLSQQAACVR